MPITYAGIPLVPPFDPTLLPDLFWHGHRVLPFDHPGYLTRNIDHLPIPAIPQEEPLRIGVLRWPTGASRWGRCDLLATGTQLTALRAATAGGGAFPLVIGDGVNTVTADMWMLEPYPISQKGTGELYLLVLVDERWWWWQRGNQSAPTTVPATWGDLISALFTSVGVTPSVASIPAAYGTPSVPRWNVGFAPLPLLIDAAAATVGMRVVRQLDGSVAVQSAAQAETSDAASWVQLSPTCYSGGRITVADIARAVPASVATVFWGYDPVAVTNTLAGLAIATYDGATGAAGKVGQIVADMPAVADSGDRTAYATQAATDYYNWALARTDATLRGIQSRLMTGNDDAMEWVHATSEIVTRILRTRAGDDNLYGNTPPGVRFPAEITAVYDPTYGYAWKRLTLDVDAPEYVDADPPKTGNLLFEVNDDQTLKVGDRVLMWSNPDGEGWEFQTLASVLPGRGFFARLTTTGTNATTSTTGWNFVPLVYADDSGWDWHDDGAETTGYPAFPLPIDGTNYAADPLAGMRVWMIPSATTPGLYEFFPVDGRDFIARLTSSGTNATTGTTGWNFYRVAYFDSGGWGWHDFGSEFTGYPAFPSTIDGTNYGATLAAGLRVRMTPSRKVAGLYEFLPIGDGLGESFYARLTTSGANGSGYGTGWKYVKQEYFDSGGYGWHDVGSAPADFVAFPSTIDGTYECNPVAGMRVRMFPSARLTGCYEFLPIGYADATKPGLVSVTTQQFAGEKEFLDGATTPEYFEADGTNGQAVLYSDFASLNLPATTAPLDIPYLPYAPTAPPNPLSVLGLNIPLVGPTNGVGGVLYGTETDPEGAGGGGEVWVVPTPNGSDQAGLMILAGRYCAYSNGYVYVGVDGPDTVLTPGGTAFTTVKTRSGIVYDGDATPFLKDVQICATRNNTGAITAIEIQKTFWNGDTETVVCVNDTTGCCEGGGGGSGGSIPTPGDPLELTDWGESSTSDESTDEITLTIPNVTAGPNEDIVVVIGSPGASGADTATVSFGGLSFTTVVSDGVAFGSPDAMVWIQAALVFDSVTDDVVVTVSGASGPRGLFVAVMTVSQVTGYFTDVDVNVTDNGTASTPSAGPDGTSNTDRTCAVACGLMSDDGSTPPTEGTWQDSFTSLHSTTLTLGGGIGAAFRFQVGYRISNASGESFTAELGSVTPDDWVMVLGSVTKE